jgi:hypothetical protein
MHSCTWTWICVRAKPFKWTRTPPGHPPDTDTDTTATGTLYFILVASNLRDKIHLKDLPLFNKFAAGDPLEMKTLIMYFVLTPAVNFKKKFLFIAGGGKKITLLGDPYKKSYPLISPHLRRPFKSH